ncbi:MAG: GAF domain-containing protein [Bacteroidota bacterium]
MKITKALRYTLIFAAAGLITVFLVIYAQRTMLNTHEGNLPFLRLADHTKATSYQAYLQFERLTSGTPGLTFEKDVMEQFTGVRDILLAAYDGRETGIGTFIRVNDEEMRALLKEAAIDADELANAAHARWTAHTAISNRPVVTDSTGAIISQPPVSTGEREQFEAAFQKFIIALNSISEYQQKADVAKAAFLNTLSWISVVAVFLVFGVLGFLVFKFQRDSDRRLKENKNKLDEEAKRVGTLSSFIESVSAGNFDIELQSDGDDSLTNMLINMRNKLKGNAEEDRRRNWSTTGLAKIGEILRTSTSTTGELYDNIIKFVVKYTHSSQGGLFILNEDNENDKYLELMACYAFERKKYLEKKINIGTGIVGQCFLEGQTIYLLEVPEEYVNITSGLGGTNPNAVLVVPMKVNDQVYGVIELASFRKYEDHEVELVEKLAESIASTISSVRVNETTRILLEKTQQQAEEMKSQEEEIRQNMEELEATQEEMRRKQTILEKELDQSQRQADVLKQQEKKLLESQDTLQAIVDNIPRAIFWKDKDLRFMGCNRIFASIAGASSPRELIGKSDYDMAWAAQADVYRKDDEDVMRKRQAKLDIEEVNINSAGEESWVLTSKVPIINQNNQVVAILGMFEDITMRKRKEADVNRKLEELRELKEMLESRKI